MGLIRAPQAPFSEKLHVCYIVLYHTKPDATYTFIPWCLAVVNHTPLYEK